MGIIKRVCGIFSVIAAVVVGLFQVAPVMLANSSFQDDLKTVSLMDSSNLQKTDEDVRKMCSASQGTRSPIEAKQIAVQRINTPGISAVYLSVNYSVTINLPGYSFDMSFQSDIRKIKAF